jgi:1-deoxy-D-xylulose-5-phosphate synthase
VLANYVPDGKACTLFRDPLAGTLVITYGRLLGNAVQAAGALRSKHPTSVLKLTRIHPIPEEAFRIAGDYQRVIFFEEGAENGGVAQRFGAELLQRKFSGSYEPHAIRRFIPTCSVEDGLRLTGLDTDSMIRFISGEATGRGK